MGYFNRLMIEYWYELRLAIRTSRSHANSFPSRIRVTIHIASLHRRLRHWFIGCRIYWASHARMCCDNICWIRRILAVVQSPRHNRIHASAWHSDGGLVRFYSERSWDMNGFGRHLVDSILITNQRFAWGHISCNRSSLAANGQGCGLSLLRSLESLQGRQENGGFSCNCQWCSSRRYSLWIIP